MKAVFKPCWHGQIGSWLYVSASLSAYDPIKKVHENRTEQYL